ncbi:PAS domain-containing protein [Roseitranquillus sediminis]|uniref:PAS domain-containing protein n=1 Tax=Roseitranquillus sediminis TaxID=2809051 RepID=UPI001D0CBE90|nr:PAS domain-containing protein [Roseitranquillus sediminis]MBM9595319.1 PAS domain-containing protein [Roseitranquillus sediminis]
MADGSGSTQTDQVMDVTLALLRDRADPILLINAEGRITFANHAALVRLVPQAFRGALSWSDLFLPEAEPSLRNTLLRSLRGENARSRLVARDGSVWDAAATPLAETSGEVTTILVTLDPQAGISG